MKHFLASFLVAAVASVSGVNAQDSISVNVDSKTPSGYINPLLYGQLFEHIYFSANNGVWQELIFERSFEPEHFPGIHPRDGYFDGWFMDDDNVLHSPTRYEQPISITSVDTDDYEISMDVNWRSYRLARRAWSGGLLDMRIAFRNADDGNPYYFRIHDPKYEARILNTAQTESQIQAAAQAQARQSLQQSVVPEFSIASMVEKETSGFGGRTRRVRSLDALVSRVADRNQINENRDWHKLKIVCKAGESRIYWDGRQILKYSGLDQTGHSDIVLWVNYTEALYRNVKVTSLNGKDVYFDGVPADVRVPDVAPQWNAFGDGEFALVKGDAVNMDYSQQIKASGRSGVSQGPQNIREGETYLGYIYAKGNGNLSVEMRAGDTAVAKCSLGIPGNNWRKFEFEMVSSEYSGDADFAVCVENGTVLVDEVSVTTRSGKELGGFRPDIFNAVSELHPTCLRWPGGGYSAQYDWKWGVGPQEKRQRWDHWMWMDYDQNAFGTDEFIRFCREVNSEPVIVVSVGFDRPDEEHDAILENALNWLRYCNAPATDEWGAKRAANGHPEPYNVKYWEIDNEMWEMGIEKYEAAVREFSTAMREIDPDIKIIVCGGFGEDADFIKRSGNYFDYMSLHHYENANGYASGPQRLGQQYDRYAEMIADGPNPNIRLFISEWNLNSIDWRTGLFAGGFLNMCEQKDVVAMGAAALFIRRTDSPDWNNAFINFDYKDLFVAPNYQVTELWYNHFSRYRLSYSGNTGDVSIAATLSEDGRDVILKIVNPTERPYRLAVNGNWENVNGAVYEYYAPGNLMTANSMENKQAVALKSVEPAVGGNSVSLELEPYSAGVLTVRKFGSAALR